MLNSPCFNFKMFLITPEIPKGLLKFAIAIPTKELLEKNKAGYATRLVSHFGPFAVTFVYANRAAVQNLKAF